MRQGQDIKEILSGSNINETVVDARVNFKARALIATMENEILTPEDLERYDVYCESFDDDADNIQIWLRDRTDDSRTGPLDLGMFRTLN